MNSIDDLKAKIKKNSEEMIRLLEGSRQAADAFNLFLAELFNPRIFPVRFQGMSTITSTGVSLNCFVEYSTQRVNEKGQSEPCREQNPVGSIEFVWPMPSEEEIAKRISAELTGWLENEHSMLLMVLTRVADSYSWATRKQLMER